MAILIEKSSPDLQINNTDVAEMDKELEKILQKQSTRIKVVGIGGGGGNSVSRMKEIGIKGCEIIAVNTDAQDLLYTNAEHKILIGRELTRGLGAGSNPKIGEQAAKESEQEIRKKLSESDIVFVTCGMGGGTGSGGTSVIAEIAKKSGALTIGIVTMPFTVEGKKRIENAQYGLEKLASVTDTLIVIPNDKLIELAPELPMHTAFKVADEILTNSVKGITELITKSGLVNLDFADVRTVMENGGVSLIGIGESDSKDRAVEAVEKAISNPLLDADIKDASGVLVNIIGGNDMTLDEYKKVMEIISKKVSPEARIISGAQISADMEKTMKVLLIVTGVKSNQILGKSTQLTLSQEEELEKELGINFLDSSKS
jgi:cell division protein FtsZ